MIFPSDKAFAGIVKQVEAKLGHKFNFADQDDREALGNAVIQYVRKQQ